MGNLGSQTPRAVLRTDVQIYFKVNRVKTDVAEVLKTWFQEGAPLALQMNAFQHLLGLTGRADAEDFFRVFDTDRNQKVDAFEVLCAVVILAQGTMDEKLDAIIPIFDFAGSGKLNFEEVNILIHCVYRGLTKVCTTPPVSDEELVEACRHMFDAHNLIYKAAIKKDQLKRWVRQDIEAMRFLNAFCRARPLVDVEAALAQRERAQADVFTQLAGDSQTVQPKDLLRSSAFRESLGNQSEEMVRSLISAMAAGEGSIGLENFVDAARAWNAFDAVDVDGDGDIDAKNIFLLIWYRQHEEPTPQQIEQEKEALGPIPNEMLTRPHWMAASLLKA